MFLPLALLPIFYWLLLKSFRNPYFVSVSLAGPYSLREVLRGYSLLVVIYALMLLGAMITFLWLSSESLGYIFEKSNFFMAIIGYAMLVMFFNWPIYHFKTMPLEKTSFGVKWRKQFASLGSILTLFMVLSTAYFLQSPNPVKIILWMGLVLFALSYRTFMLFAWPMAWPLMVHQPLIWSTTQSEKSGLIISSVLELSFYCILIATLLLGFVQPQFSSMQMAVAVTVVTGAVMAGVCSLIRLFARHMVAISPTFINAYVPLAALALLVF